MTPPNDNEADEPVVLSATASLRASATVYGVLTVSVRRFYDQLLESASRLINDVGADQFTFCAAIALAATACEVAAGTAAATIAKEKYGSPTDEVMKLSVRTFDLGVERIRNTWNVIANDAVQDQAFWVEFTKHLDRRNSVVHTGMVKDPPIRKGDEPVGRSATKADAEASVDVAHQLIEHIKTVLRGHGFDSYA